MGGAIPQIPRLTAPPKMSSILISFSQISCDKVFSVNRQLAWISGYMGLDNYRWADLGAILDWKYYIPHVWEGPTKECEDIWLWPIGKRIRGNMEGKINLDVSVLRPMLSDRDEESARAAQLLAARSLPYWFWPYPVEGWGDEVSMVVNCAEFSRTDLKRYAKIYLEHVGYEVSGMIAATDKDTFSGIGEEEE